MKIFNCTLPIKTISEANCRDHWAKKAKRVKEQRRIAYLTARQHFGILSESCLSTIIVSFTRIATRKLDDDNVRSALKAIRDGIADYLQVDDGNERITWIYDQNIEKKANHVALAITVIDE